MKNENQKPIKIIQLIQDADPDEAYDLYGLGDDGVVYCANFKERKWKVLFPLPSDPNIEEGGDNE